MQFRTLSMLLLLSSSVTTLLAADRVDLDRNWQFRIDAKEQGESDGWANTMPAGTEEVRVPHSRNIGPHDDHKAWRGTSSGTSFRRA